jgi:thiol:disulfide interchange protein
LSNKKITIRGQSEAKELLALVKKFTKPTDSLISEYNRQSLTASLSTEPIIPRHIFYPDTSKKTTQTAIDTVNKKGSQTPNPSPIYSQEDEARKKKAETYAILALISALLALLLMLFLSYIPVYIPFSIAAIILGKKGLASSKSKMARTSIIMGIVSLAITVLVLLVLLLQGGYDM